MKQVQEPRAQQTRKQLEGSLNCCGGGSDSVAELARELHRRVRWLERVILETYYSPTDRQAEHRIEEVTDEASVKVKSTPEDFK